MYLLDTNTVSELRRRDRTHPAVGAWADSVPPTDLYISAITLYELLRGAFSIARRDAVQGQMLLDWIDQLTLTGFAGR